MSNHDHEGRLLAIGDIHGCATALDALLRLLRPTASDTIVTVGDYVNRGPDSRGVLDQLIALRERCTLVPLLGNHDDLLLSNRARRSMNVAAQSDLEDAAELFDDRHFEFLQSCSLYYETDSHFFVHANYDPRLPLSEQDRYTLLWLHLHNRMPRRHRSKKVAIVGHTSQPSGEVLNRRHILCIDTYCHGGGWLTAVDVHTRQLWQVDRHGQQRRGTT